MVRAHLYACACVCEYVNAYLCENECVHVCERACLYTYGSRAFVWKCSYAFFMCICVCAVRRVLPVCMEGTSCGHY
jgi:hypothetical protein